MAVYIENNIKILAAFL